MVCYKHALVGQLRDKKHSLIIYHAPNKFTADTESVLYGFIRGYDAGAQRPALMGSITAQPGELSYLNDYSHHILLFWRRMSIELPNLQ